jgi:hypothetical protein
MRTYRIGHTILRQQDREVPVQRSTIKPGLKLRSESGRIVDVAGVQSARTVDGTEVMIAPNGAVIDHPEHGTIEIPPGTYEVSQIGEAKPEEERARGIRFESPQETPTSLTREQRD